MATASTVDFGDVVAKTCLGWTFIIFFTLGSLILFANYVLEMVELFANKRKYTSSYKVVKGKKFIMVCGNITVDSVTAFLRNFLHRKSGEINTEIVFLGDGLILNPPAEVRLHKNTLGFFVTESTKDVKRAAFYCAACHSDVYTPELIGKCSCKSKNHRHITGATPIKKKSSQKEFSSATPRGSFPREQSKMTSSLSITPRTFLYETEDDSDQLDSSGVFHWCKATPLDRVILGSALFPEDLHAVSLEECSMCAVLSSPSTSSSSQTLVDTEAIMATLNVGSLRIGCSAQTEPDKTTPLTERGRGEWREERELTPV
ncbi:potassium channel subfamily U member 1 [Manis javanica]|uniref:potassium channel subfamily U member 1 n=1 Tax=Manis javanica TaxID=9974 RepID=UPI003C6D2698